MKFSYCEITEETDRRAYTMSAIWIDQNKFKFRHENVEVQYSRNLITTSYRNKK